MKYFVKFFVITLLVLLCTYAQADNSQIRFINLKVILNESKAGKEAQGFLKKSAQENINKFIGLLLAVLKSLVLIAALLFRNLFFSSVIEKLIFFL